jgi:hypothetical protein
VQRKDKKQKRDSPSLGERTDKTLSKADDTVWQEMKNGKREGQH